MLIAATCHDLGHDGFNNIFHVNMNTRRSLDANDESVQEWYHSAELFRTLGEDKGANNFVEAMSREEFHLFRKRVIGLILATDMAKHSGDLRAFNQLMEMNDIQNGNNIENLFKEDLS